IEMNLKQVAFPWKVIIFNGKDAPVLAKPEEAARLFQMAMGISSGDQKRKSTSGNPTLSTPDTSFFKTQEPVKDARELNELSDLKETTLRLLIYPGQPAPPARDETSDIRVVSSYISPHHRFWLFFDNDMFSNTDRYYTNGVVLGYTAPGLTSWGLNRLMINMNSSSVVHSSLSLHHNMFTPLTTKEPPPLVNDRPYASTLYVRFSQVSENAGNGIRISSALEAGVIGDIALGRYFQRSVHSGLPSNDEPIGWETQIQNDLVLNYQIDIQKQLILSPDIEVYAEGTLNAGTLHTNASMGINAVAGFFSPGLTPVPQNYEQLTTNESPWKYGINGGLEFRMIAYDATLQGGLFNKNNIYALKPNEIERLVAAIHLGLFAKYRKLGINISQYYLSPEFKEGRQHFWGQIGLLYGL
ncbi:MAG: lipid A deacylase LpxR family protein, partial [Lentimicrobium sp.]|nr:lipid A deacylase LpxR family protein [Lentimicrobium sp.]